MVPLTTHRERIVRVDQTEIVSNAVAETHLSTDISAASSTLTVSDIERFAVGRFVWINPHSPHSEIIAVHASTAPSGSTITLASNTAFAHSASEKVYYIEFDKVEVSHSATATGSKSVLATPDLAASDKEFRYRDISQTAGVYFVRFNDSIASIFGDYTDAIPYDGWNINSVGYMIDRALHDLNIDLSELVTLNDCYAWLTDGMRFMEGKLMRWPEHISYDEVIGQAQRGDHTTSMPALAYDRETNKSIIGVRIGDNKNLTYLDPRSFDDYMGNVRFTQVRTEASANDASLALDNSYDFFDGSSASPATATVYVANVKDTFTYTAVTRDDVSGASAAFTGIPTSGDNAIGQTVVVDTFVWQNERENIPRFYTVRNSNMEFWPLVDGNNDNANIYMDYSLVATAIDSDSDVIDFQRFDALNDYLRWRMKMKQKNNGELDMNDHFYVQFKEKLNDAIRTLPPNNKFKMMPKINRMSKHGGLTSGIRRIPIEDQ